MPADDAAVVTHFFDAWAYFHDSRTRSGCGVLLVAVGDATSLEVVGRQFNLHLVARKDPDVVHAHLARDVGKEFVAVI